MNGNGNGATESFEYDPASETYRATFDSATVAASIAVAEVVANVCGEALARQKPLYEAIDPDALDKLYTTSVGDHVDRDLTVEFTYLDHRVRIERGGTIEVRRSSSEDSDADDR